MRATVLVVAAGLLLASCGETAKTQEAARAATDRGAQEEANKKVAMAFFREGVTPEERYALLHPDYIQHNPQFKRFGEINGIKGREEFLAVMEMRRTNPPPPPDPKAPKGDPLYLVMAEGDLVTVIQKRYRPDPVRPGQYYEHFWYDTWRIKDGKLYEHWDPAVIPDGEPDPVPGFVRTPLRRP